MRVILCGGGTVGHISPALAIAEALKVKYKKCDILFIGRSGGDENRPVQAAKIPMKEIEISGFKRKLCIGNIKIAHRALKAYFKAKKIIKDYSPDIVIGTGGYVCWPVLRAAISLRIPAMVHESNACPGLVTKAVASKIDRVLLNLEGSDAEFKRKDNLRTVGNPIRADFINSDRRLARRKLGISDGEILISSFGGSGGSEKMNHTILAIMTSHSVKNKKIKHIHSCGRKYYKSIKEKYPTLTKGNRGCIIKPFIDDMPTVISASDIVISRCGAMTLGEICAVGVAPILIPSPNVTNNHQYKNAKLLADDGAAIMIEESALDENSLLNAIKSLESDGSKRAEMAFKTKRHFVEDSIKRILDEIEAVSNMSQ